MWEYFFYFYFWADIGGKHGGKENMRFLDFRPLEYRVICIFVPLCLCVFVPLCLCAFVFKCLRVSRNPWYLEFGAWSLDLSPSASRLCHSFLPSLIERFALCRLHVRLKGLFYRAQCRQLFFGPHAYCQAC